MARGTHQGAFQGIPPTGLHVAWEGISILRIADGQIVDRWFHADVLGLRQQIVGASSPGQPNDQLSGGSLLRRAEAGRADPSGQFDTEVWAG